MPVVVKIDPLGFGPTAPLAPAGAYASSRGDPLAGWRRPATPPRVAPTFRAGPPALVLTESPAPGLLSYAMTTGSLPDPDAPLVVAAAGDPPAREGRVPAPDLPGSDLARRYCVSIADSAAEARIAWQKAKLAEAEQEIDKRIAALEAKTAEYRTWLERREKFSRKVTKKLVDIYAKMDPEAAAMQLISMDEEAAASILVKLDPRDSSAVLNEMQPEKAARLAATLVGAARVPGKSPAAPRPAGGSQGGAPEQAGAPDQANGEGGGL